MLVSYLYARETTIRYCVNLNKHHILRETFRWNFSKRPKCNIKQSNAKPGKISGSFDERTRRTRDSVFGKWKSHWRLWSWFKAVDFNREALCHDWITPGRKEGGEIGAYHGPRGGFLALGEILAGVARPVLGKAAGKNEISRINCGELNENLTAAKEGWIFVSRLRGGFTLYIR